MEARRTNGQPESDGSEVLADRNETSSREAARQSRQHAVTVRLEEDLYRRLKASSALSGKTINDVATSLFRDWVEGVLPSK